MKIYLNINNRCGSLLVMTLIFMITLAVIGAAALSGVMTTNITATSLVDRNKAFYIAEAGMNEAIYDLLHTAPNGSTVATWRTVTYPSTSGSIYSGCSNGSCIPYTNIMPVSGIGSYTVWVDTYSSSIRITSQGTYAGITRIIQQRFTYSSGTLTKVSNTWQEL